MMAARSEYRSVRLCPVTLSGAPAAAIVNTGYSWSHVSSAVVHHFRLSTGKLSDNRVFSGSITAIEYALPIFDV